MLDILSKAATTKPDIVRIATQSDESRLFALLHRLHAECPNPGNLKVSDDRVWQYVNSCCRGQGGIAGVVDGSNGDLIASIGIFPVNPWWTDEWHLSQHWMYVDPEYRYGGKLHKSLLKFARWHRDDMAQRLGYRMGFENSFLTKGNILPRLRLWRQNAGRPIGVLFWDEG